MFRLCFVWVYIIKGKFPLLSLQASAGFVQRTFLCACGIDSHFNPKSFYLKGNKTAFNGFYCRTIFCDVKPSFRFYIVKGLERLTNFSSRRAYVQKTGLAIGLFCGTIFQVLRSKIEYLRIINPCRSSTLLGEIFTRIFLFTIGKEVVTMQKKLQFNMC